MDELIRIQKAIQLLLNNWDSLVHKFILSNEPLFVDTVHSQLEKGEAGDGSKLDTYSTPDYSRFKKAIGSMSSPIADLKLTGDFYGGMIMNNNLEIFSTDWKNNLLKQMWGDDIMEVQDNNLDKIITEQILPDFEHYIRKQIGL